MGPKLLLCGALVLSGAWFVLSPAASFADEPAAPAATNSFPQTPTNIWKYIDYYSFKPQQEWDGRPMFLLTSGKQYDQVSLGLRLDIMEIAQGFRFFKTNAVTARLYRANGEIVEPTAESKKLLNAPISVETSSYPGEEPIPQVMTYFPWGTNAMEESWIEVSIPPDRYWLEVPYGFDRNPADPLPPSVKGGAPQFISAMKSLTEHDHVVRWVDVQYDLGRTHDGGELSLIQSNPFDAESKIEFYADHGPKDLYSPRTEAHILDADGSVIKSRCVDLHLGDSTWGRTDTFDFFDRSTDDLRGWGQLEINVDKEAFSVVIPSSLYKYVHGHALKPTTIDFRAGLRVGMKLMEVDGVSRNHDCVRDSVASAPHQYRYAFKHDGGQVTLQFDESDRLVNWK
ncbi:MAG TPA: hypothetical protein VG938_09405 [Verrucomicrobiae bacterium]|nr:hypothetical protein [Verrucomicrobiae bacterium]